MVNWGEGAKGAAGGAAAGTAILPGWGTAIGAGVGGLIGLFSGDSDADEARKRQLEYYNALNRQGPAQTAGYSEFRGNQRAFINNLENMAAGRGPSLAAEQLKAATDRSTKQSIGLAQSGAGNPAAAMMMAQEASGQMGAQNAQTAASARIQEQLNAMNLLGINLHGARGMDEEMNRFNASSGNRWNMDSNQLRAMLLQGMAGNASNVSTGDQIMAGGAGMYGASLAAKGSAPAKQAPANIPLGGPGTSTPQWQNTNPYINMPQSWHDPNYRPN